MDSNKTEQNGIPVQIGTSAAESAKTVTGVTRREWFRAAAGGCVGLALGGLVDVAAVRASTQKLKLSDINEFTTSCNPQHSGAYEQRKLFEMIGARKRTRTSKAVRPLEPESSASASSAIRAQ